MSLSGSGHRPTWPIWPQPDSGRRGCGWWHRLGISNAWVIPPKQPEDLAGHDLLALVPAMTGRVAWPLARDGCIELYSVAPRLRVNGLANIVACVHAGLGIAQLPEFAAAAGVASGDMLRVLAAYTPEVGGINIVYPHTRLLAPRVRAFVEASSLRLGRTGATESSPRQGR